MAMTHGPVLFSLWLYSTVNWIYLIINRLNDIKGLIQRKKGIFIHAKICNLHTVDTSLARQRNKYFGKQYFGRHLRVPLGTSEIFVLKAIRIARIT